MMKVRKCSWSVYYLLITLVMTGVVLSGCHPRVRSDASAQTKGAPQSLVQPAGTPNPRLCPIPQTGQGRKFRTADDGDLKAGKPWPEPRFTDNGDGTVTDRLTGLMWTRNAKQEDGPVEWEQAVSGAGACAAGGFTDWRLPNRRELESLLDSGRFDPALPAGHPFLGVQPSYYWSSSTTANSEDDAWTVHFYIGFVTHDDKAGSHFVWYVRDGS
jgi:hypothetical protein